MRTRRPIGIDYGTTNSVVSYATDVGTHYETETVPVDGGSNRMPSVVYFGPDETIIGRTALNKLGANPGYVARSTKRFLGSDPARRFPPETEEYSPVGVASEVIGKLAADAEDYLEARVDRAVVTVPADFSDNQRRLTRKAAEMSGLSVESLISEPTAAALAYDLRDEDDETVLVFDLGGGTFDASLIDIADSIYAVDGTRGDNDLGGDDWTDAIVEFLVEHVEGEHGLTVPAESEDPVLHGRLWLEAERMKVELSSRESVTGYLQYLDVGGETITVEATITREEFEWRTEALRERIVDHLEELFATSAYDPDSLSEVLLVGGSTRLPQIPALIEDALGLEPRRSKHPDEMVATGAAIQAAIVGDTPALDGETQEQGQQGAGAGPGEEGAGTVRTGEGTVSVADAVVLDAATRSLGIQTQDQETGRMEYYEIIPNNATIPTEVVEEDFVPYEADPGKPGASNVDITVFESAETDPTDDFREKTEMGTLKLRDLDPTTPREDQRIDITFDLDEDNILNVRAVERTTGTDVRAEFEPSRDYDSEEFDAERANLPRAYEQ